MALKQGGWDWRSPPPFSNKMIRINRPHSKHGDGMMLFYCKHGWPKKLRGLGATIATRIVTPTPTIPVAVDSFQTQGGSKVQKQPWPVCGFRVTPPGLVRNERMVWGL